MASRRAQNASTSSTWRGESLRAGGPEAHFRISDGRDNDALAAQHRLLQALQDGFRLLAHDERADTGVEHIGLVHRLNRPSSLTTSSRSAIKSGSAFSNCANEPRGRPDGTQNNAVPFPDDLQLAHSLKIQIAGQTNGAVIAVFKNGYSSHHFLPGRPACMTMFSICRCKAYV